jgi:hypothetical protein
LTRPESSSDDLIYPLGFRSNRYRGLYRQMLWAAESINRGYYGWRMGTLTELELSDGRLVRPDPWLNAGTAALHVLLAERFGQADFDAQTGPQGLQQTYRELWGDPFARQVNFIPGNLQQADLHYRLCRTAFGISPTLRHVNKRSHKRRFRCRLRRVRPPGMVAAPAAARQRSDEALVA